MPKWKLLTLGILFAVLAFTTFMPSRDPAAFWLLLPSAIFLSIWFYRHRRDQKIVSQARQELEMVAQTPSPDSPTTSGGNDRLFVPLPLDQDTRRH